MGRVKNQRYVGIRSEINKQYYVRLKKPLHSKDKKTAHGLGERTCKPYI